MAKPALKVRTFSRFNTVMNEGSERRVTVADFKGHVSKVFGAEMRKLGFKGSGFQFVRDSENFAFVVAIQGSMYRSSCCANFGIQPKFAELNRYKNIDFKKLKFYDCELKTRISPRGKGDYWWNYSADPDENVKIALEIVALLERQYMPIIDHFTNNPNLLLSIDPSDLEEGGALLDKLAGMSAVNTTSRLAWMFAVLNENTDLEKAKGFAAFGLSEAKVKTFFGNPDFERILAK